MVLQYGALLCWGLKRPCPTSGVDVGVVVGVDVPVGVLVAVGVGVVAV